MRSYSYDARDWFASITQGSDTIACDDAGGRISPTLSNGVTVDYGYDNVNRSLSLIYRYA